ncbi:hypothetical protein SASPL_154118 [Salvia splendens]|uniref:FCP1 homology domain-containing protein n=1 Tax=Salvia splendens TaxID=180675 RepID=A0A8X8YYE1_SALSN|nr:hypothetical protein SASPL_154118 [Salvia splendens]
MEETKSSTQFDEDDDEFHDAVDEFEFYYAVDEFEFHDCRENFSDQTESSRDESISNPSSNALQEDKSPALAVLRRRRSRSIKKSSADGSEELARFAAAESVDNLRERRNVSLSPKLDEREMRLEETKPGSQSIETSEEKSTVTDAIAAARGEESSWRGNEDSNPGFLLKLPGIVIERIALLVKIVTFTIRLVYYLYMIVFNPLGLLLPFRWFIIQQLKKIRNLMFGIVIENVYEWLKEQRAIWKLGLKCGWGLLWSAYVCSVLLGLLVSAFVVGGVLIRLVVEEPIRMIRNLNFDYSEKSPVALVPIMSGVKMNGDMRHFMEKPEILKACESRVMPRGHGVHVTVSLTLPESEYNQHLGMFQVFRYVGTFYRVDFLAADGQILAILRRPCMLKYRSQSIRLLLTLLKVAPILTGYTSETQKLKANFKEFTEGDPPTASIRVILEQRPEYSSGAGIPEIYSASLALESELPLLKRIMWFWKKTVFVWVSMSVFMIELVFALLCCRPLIIPKIRLWEATPQEGASHYNHPQKHTIFLDLDETLIHSTAAAPPERYDFVVRPVIDGQKTEFYVLKRPFVDEFLAYLSDRFEIVIFTAGIEEYASLVVDKLNWRNGISHRLYRDSCRAVDGMFVKDLGETGRDLSRAVIVDDNPNSYQFQPENAIPIKQFVDDVGDEELKKMMELFEGCDLGEDLRDFVRVFVGADEKLC